MIEPPIVISFNFQHMYFEFRANGEIFVTDRIYKIKYKMVYNEHEGSPFTIFVEGKDVKDD